MIDIQFRAQKCSITDSNYKLSCGTCSEPVEISGKNRKESVHTTQWPEQVKSANTVLLQPSAAGAMQRRKRMEKVWSIQRVQMRSVRSSISAFWNQPVAPVGTNEHLEYFEGAGSLHHMAIMRLHRFLAMEFRKSENPIGESSASLSHCHNADYVNNTQ